VHSPKAQISLNQLIADYQNTARLWRIPVQGSMRSDAIAVGVGFQEPTHRSDQPFGKAILPRRVWWLVPDAHGAAIGV
jgi:hypothetical protein